VTDAEMETILIYSLIVASVSFTVAEAAVFKGLRNWILLKSKFFGKLFKCGFCLGYWVSFILVAIFQPHLDLTISFIDLIFSW
jgi:hypothetical protein